MNIEGSAAKQLQSMQAAAIWLFGSRARGDHRLDSDADVALLLRDGAPIPGLIDQTALAEELRLRLHVESVDIVVLDSAPLMLRGRILVEGKLLWSADDVRRVRFTVETLSRYFDIKPTVEQQDKAYIAAIAERGFQANGRS